MIDNIRPWSRQRLRKRLAVKSCLPRPESSMVTDNCTTSDHANVGTTRPVMFEDVKKRSFVAQY